MAAAPERILGRYALFGEIASGGMGSVHYGRLLAAGGFSRTVAIKSLHAPFARDPEFVRRFLEEARLAARVRHPNVLPTLDVVELGDEVFLVLELVLGESLAGLVREAMARNERVPLGVAAQVIVGTLHGLHAAHEARDENGAPLGIVHRDVSPQNVVVGIDGVARVLDFGIAKAEAAGGERTRAGVLKGKLGYLAPEQIRGERLDRRVDVYAAAVTLWELLTSRRLFATGSDEERLDAILHGEVAPPSSVRDDVPAALDAVVLRGLARERGDRFASALEMATALEAAVAPASTTKVGAWVEALASEALRVRRETIAEIERSASFPDEKSEPFLLGARSTPIDATVPDVPAALRTQTPRITRHGRKNAILVAATLAFVAAGVGFRAHVARRNAAHVDANAGSKASSGVGVAEAAVAPACVGQALSDVVQLSAGPASHHTCARTRAGEIWCWGDDREGQLGLGSTDAHVGARRVPKLDRVAQVAVGNAHTCARLEDGHVSCWGKGLVLRPALVMDVVGADDLAAGGRFTCARVKDAIECWGEDDAGQLGTSAGEAALVSQIEGLRAPVRFATGTSHACAIERVGARVACWGSDAFGQLGNGATDAAKHPSPIEVALPARAFEIATGDKTTFAWTADGVAYGWGFAVKRPVQVPLDHVSSIAAGGRLACARRDDGSIWCWGFNEVGELGGEGDDAITPVRVAGVSDATSVVAGDEHACVLRGGEVLCWGGNKFGELGLAPDALAHPSPVRVNKGECP